MSDNDLLRRYNYDSFIHANFQPWMRFDEAPAPGTTITDFDLFDLDASPTTLSAILGENRYTVVEFGSFT